MYKSNKLKKLSMASFLLISSSFIPMGSNAEATSKPTVKYTSVQSHSNNSPGCGSGFRNFFTSLSNRIRRLFSSSSNSSNINTSSGRRNKVNLSDLDFNRRGSGDYTNVKVLASSKSSSPVSSPNKAPIPTPRSTQASINLTTSSTQNPNNTQNQDNTPTKPIPKPRTIFNYTGSNNKNEKPIPVPRTKPGLKLINDNTK